MYAVAATNRIYHLVRNERTLCGLRIDSVVFDHDGTLVPVRMIQERPASYSLCANCDAENRAHAHSSDKK
jgi:hypothetical protein